MPGCITGDASLSYGGQLGLVPWGRKKSVGQDSDGNSAGDNGDVVEVLAGPG